MTFKNDVRVGAAEAEGVDPYDKFAGLFKLPGFGYNLKVPVVEMDVWIRSLDTNSRRHYPMLDAVQRLDQPRHAGCRFEMAEIALHRTDEEGGVFGAALT